jgi:hypothetical protein
VEYKLKALFNRCFLRKGDTHSSFPIGCSCVNDSPHVGSCICRHIHYSRLFGKFYRTKTIGIDVNVLTIDWIKVTATPYILGLKRSELEFIKCAPAVAYMFTFLLQFRPTTTQFNGRAFWQLIADSDAVGINLVPVLALECRASLKIGPFPMEDFLFGEMDLKS